MTSGWEGKMNIDRSECKSITNITCRIYLDVYTEN